MDDIQEAEEILAEINNQIKANDQFLEELDQMMDQADLDYAKAIIDNQRDYLERQAKEKPYQE